MFMKVLSTKLITALLLCATWMPLSVYSQITGSTNVCAGQTVTYSSSSSAATYQWSVNGAQAYSASGNSVTVEWGINSPGTVNLVTYNSNNIQTGSYSESITISAKPNPVILSSFQTNCFDNTEGNVNDCFVACLDRPVYYSSPFSAGTSYTWEIIGNGTMTTIATNEIEVVWHSLGEHRVKLTVSNGAGCTNEYENCVVVIESPTAEIDASPLIGDSLTLCLGNELNLQDSSIGSVGRRWDFGDGTFSDKPNTAHTYDQAGVYVVILTANNSCYCLDSDTLIVTVTDDEGPEIICPGVVCKGDTLSYSTPSSCTSFKWTVTNGTIIGSDSGTAVDVIWNSHLAYIELEGFGCNSTCNSPTVEKIPVIADSIPIQGPTLLCDDDEAVYSIPPLPGSTYSWSVSSTLGTIIEDHGYYIRVKITGDNGTVSLSYTNPVLACSGSTSLNVTAKPRLIFSMPSEVCQNDTDAYIFTHPIDWTILDTAGQQVYADSNTTEVYMFWPVISPGDYTLIVGRGEFYCEDLYFQISVLAPPDTVDTIYGPKTICQDKAYDYSVDPKSGFAVEWIIQGGSPSSALGNQVSVRWDTTGPYVIKAAYRQLEAPNCLSDYHVQMIGEAYTGSPKIIAADSACGGDTMHVKLNFIADDVQWTIIPNDGASILSDRFKSEIVVQFSAASTQSITLKAEGSVCDNAFTLTHPVYVKSFPAPDISVSDSVPCPGTSVRFTTSASSPTWTINGQIYTTADPTLSFDSAMVVPVKVSVTYTGPLGCTVERVHVDNIRIKQAPKARITALDSNFTRCQDTLIPIILTANLQGATSGNYTYTWLKNDTVVGSGSSYTTTAIIPHGDYRVIAVAPNGCTDTSDVYEIDYNCGGICSYQQDSLDPAITVQLASTGCSEFYVSSVNPSGAHLHSFVFHHTGETTNTGPYSEGIIIDRVGTQSLRMTGAAIVGTDTVCFDTSIFITVNAIPDFNIIREDCGETGLVKYKMQNTSLYASSPPTFTWDFGNGTVVSSGFDPIVKYLPLQDTVKLSIGAGCSVSKIFTPMPPTIASFTSSAPACQQEPVQFSNYTVGNIAEYKWDFGANELFEEHPSVTFIHSSNNYSNTFFPEVKLFVLNENGCRDTTSQTLTIRGNEFDPNSGLIPSNPPSICEGDSIQLVHFQFLSNSNTPISYLWSNLETSSSIQAKQTGDYNLSMTDNVGCRFVTEKVNIQVHKASNPTIIGKQTFCADDSVKLSVLNHPSYTITWFIDSVATSPSQTGANYSDLLPSGSYFFNINTVNTTSGCSHLNAPFPVTVLSQLPSPTITPTPGYPLCEGGPIQLNASPSGGNFYWNTGQTGNSITQSLAGRYTVFQTNTSGCVSHKYIDINPKPDFANFMTGCYCLPSVSPPDLLGIPGMASYQWIKDGTYIPSPTGQLQNIPASTGRFELIATTDSACVDSAGYMDITLGGCEECVIDISDLNVSCAGTNGDTVFYSFTLNADINNAPASYDATYAAYVDNKPVLITQVQPDTVAGTGNQVTGSFYLLGGTTTDSICITLTASNPGVNCQDEVCIALEPLSCDFTPDFSYTINPYTCFLQLSQDANYGFCASGDSVMYSWTVTQGLNTYTGSGSAFSVDSLVQGNAEVCLQMQVFNPLDSTWCTKDTCKTIVIPNCECEDDCINTEILSVEFQQFVTENDSCFVEFKIVLDNANSVVIYPNYFKTTDGQGFIKSITSTFAGPNEVAYIVKYYPKQPAQCGEQCFELYLFEGGSSCCLNFCVNLPVCSCNLKLTELEVSCSNTSNGYYDFSVVADLTGCNGFDYDLLAKVTLGGKTVPIVTQNITTLSNGVQTLSGTVDLSGKTGETICIDVTSSLGGISCKDKICVEMPEVDCEIEPSFDVEFDASTCTLILTNTSTTSPCVRLDTTKVDWTINYNGQTITASGQSLTFYNISDTEIEVCLDLTAVDYSGNITCTTEYCETVEVERCECENECEEMEVSLSEFVSFVHQGNSCLLRLEIEITNNSGVGYTINSILADLGTVVNYTLTQTSGTVNTYQVDVYPNQPWNGGTICFEAYIQKTGGGICCLPFCINLPKCGCDLELSDIALDCTGPYGNPGDFYFSFTADLDGTAGYNYVSGLTATLNGNPVSVNYYTPSNLVDGTQTVSGLITLAGGSQGDTICFTLSAALGGDTCTATICDTLPHDTCDVVPNFSWSLDTTTCTLTLTDSSQFSSCTYIQTYQWALTPGGAYTDSSFQVSFNGLDSMIVCLTTLSVNYTGTNDCHPNMCDTIYFPPCTIDGSPSERKKTPEKVQDISVYPNPAKSTLFIEWPELLEEEVSISLKDHQSRTVMIKETEVNGNKLELDINAYSEGMYILEIQWKGQLNRKKIVILR